MNFFKENQIINIYNILLHLYFFGSFNSKITFLTIIIAKIIFIFFLFLNLIQFDCINTTYKYIIFYFAFAFLVLIKLILFLKKCLALILVFEILFRNNFFGFLIQKFFKVTYLIIF